MMNNGASTNDNEVVLGVLPSSSACCVVYAGQHSRMLKQNVPIDSAVSKTDFKDNLVLDDVIIPVLDEVTVSGQGARDSAKYLLKRLQHEDAILTSLR
eukprot:31651-Ditylum_brightwellii.AAC.1